jgi:hypothetical protein
MGRASGSDVGFRSANAEKQYADIIRCLRIPMSRDASDANTALGVPFGRKGMGWIDRNSDIDPPGLPHPEAGVAPRVVDAP